VLDLGGDRNGALATALSWLLTKEILRSARPSRDLAEALFRGAPDDTKTPEAMRALAFAYFGAVPIPPEGGAWSFGPDGVRDPLRGSASAPIFPRLPVADSPVDRLLAALDLRAAAARARFASRIPGLALHAADVERDELRIEPVELVFAALLFEHADAGIVLEKIRAWLAPDGALTTVLQLPSETLGTITPSPFASLERLAPRMRLIAPERLAELAAQRGFRLLESDVAAASGGKEFAVQTFDLPTRGA